VKDARVRLHIFLVTLHNMIVEGLSMPAAQRKAPVNPHAEGLAGEWSLLRNRNIFRLSAVGSFLD
jgi:hypothetical protein